MKTIEYNPENLNTLLGRRLKTSLDYRLLFLHYSKTYDSWGIYLVDGGAYIADLEHVSAEKICDWLNNPNYTIMVMPGFFDGRK